MSLASAATRTSMHQLEEKMEQLLATDDPEQAHMKADDLLCQALLLSGEPRLVALFGQLVRWYS